MTSSLTSGAISSSLSTVYAPMRTILECEAEDGIVLASRETGAGVLEGLNRGVDARVFLGGLNCVLVKG